MRLLFRLVTIIAAFHSQVTTVHAADATAQHVTFPSGERTLQGFIWKPDGNGPFPSVLYNHGSEKLPGSFPTLGAFWTQQGYVFFVPHRAGHGRSPGDYIVDLQQQFQASESDPQKVKQKIVQLHENANVDVVAALSWLKLQSEVDAKRIAVAGISYGGIQTLLTAEKALGVRGFVAFSPAAMSWAGNTLLRERLLEAVNKAQAPLFLLQAKNDYNLGPSELLGEALRKRGAPNRASIYPPFGKVDDPRDGHGGFAVRGSAMWGADVLTFLREVMKP
jgi:carboxymethylenebutenolidase